MSAVLPAVPRLSSSEIVPYTPEPDVTWGTDGIDDWGWADAELRENSAMVSTPESS